MSIVALLTDFGTRDWFVGSMKGVILGISPHASIVDVTHDIAQGDVRSAAFVLECCRGAFPEGTVFVVVVDPGVGSSRRSIVVRADGKLFVGPDNGVFSYLMEAGAAYEVHEATASELFRKPVSATFHGRDVFAPLGAHLSSGVPLSAVGPVCDDPVVATVPRASLQGETVRGEVLYLDRFGNALTNIHRTLLGRLGTAPAVVEIAGTTVPFCSFYEQQARGRPLALIDSSDLLEVAVNSGSAAERLGLAPGTPVVVRTSPAASLS